MKENKELLEVLEENKAFEERVEPFCDNGVPVIGKMLDEIDALKQENEKLKAELKIIHIVCEKILSST